MLLFKYKERKKKACKAKRIREKYVPKLKDEIKY